MKLNYEQIIEWASLRGILTQSTAQFQMIKATEEHGEMVVAVLNANRENLIDSIGDQLVVAIIQCVQLGYMDELEEWLDVSDYTFNVYSDKSTPRVIQQLREVLLLTSQQGHVAASIARSRCVRGDFDNLFDHIFRVCHVFSISPHDALDSVYDIISKRGGEMKNGVWVKSEDL